jgi:hypothetical protein
MSLDREAIVATAERAYAHVASPSRSDPGGVTASAVRPGVMQQISAARVDLHVTDEEVLGSLRTASGSHA